MSEHKGRGRRILIWTIVIVVALPLLFLLFEYVNTNVFPSNF